MNPWRALSRAEYWWQPMQLTRRAWRRLHRPARGEMLPVMLPWGFPIRVDPRESIGRSIVALNTLDLPVTEAIWRLLEPGETAADVGANLGYMTAVMAGRLRLGGKVHAFEPLPELARRLRDHVVVWQSLGSAALLVHELAASDASGTAALHVPVDNAANHGTASLAASLSGGSTRPVVVRCITLDDHFPDQDAPQVLKVDVEGCEARVFRGATRLLSGHRIRDIVFEELQPPPTEATRLLASHGYHVFRIERTLLRPRLAPARGPAAGQMDPPSYLATVAPERAAARFQPIGWRSLRSAAR